MTNKSLTLPAIFLGLSIATGPTLAGYFIYKGISDAKQADRYVTVKGLVEKTVKSDGATWVLNTRSPGNDLEKLYQELTTTQKIIKDFLVRAGFIAEEITFSAPSVNDALAQEWRNGEGPQYRYILSSSITVKTANVDLVEKAAQSAGQLMQQGIALSGMNTSYQLRNFNELRPQLIAEATKSARLMAEQFAENSGSQVGSIRKANQGVIQILTPDSDNEWADNSTSIMKKVRVVSTIDFFLTN